MNMELLFEYQGFTAYEAESIHQSSELILEHIEKEISCQFHKEA